MIGMSRLVKYLLILILVVTVIARKSEKGSNIIIISPPASNPEPQQQQPPLPPSQYMMHQFQMPPPPPPTFAPPPPMSIPYPMPIPMSSMSEFMHRSGLLSTPSLPPPMPAGLTRELLRSVLASSSMNMPSDYSMGDMNMESSMASESYMSMMDPRQKMLQALLPNFLVLPIKIPQGSFSGSGRGGSRSNKIPKSIADLMANHGMSMEESRKKESILNESDSSEALRRSSHSDHSNSLVDPNPTWDPSMEINESLW